MDDLIGLIPTDDIINELERRCDALCIAMYKNKGNNVGETDCIWRGGLYQCQGIIENLRMDLRDEIVKSREAV